MEADQPKAPAQRHYGRAIVFLVLVNILDSSLLLPKAKQTSDNFEEELRLEGTLQRCIESHKRAIRVVESKVHYAHLFSEC